MRTPLYSNSEVGMNEFSDRCIIRMVMEDVHCTRLRTPGWLPHQASTLASPKESPSLHLSTRDIGLRGGRCASMSTEHAMFSRLVLQMKVGQGIAANLVVSCGGGVAKYLL